MNKKISVSNKSLVKISSSKNHKLVKPTAKKSDQLEKLVSQLLNCCDE